jgi:hypothetical protein
MTYTVQPQPGDCLCSIARREGFSNCGTLRSQPANRPVLDGVLGPSMWVTIPQARDTYFHAAVATGRRWTVRWWYPEPVPQPTRVRLVRTVSTPPADTDVIPNIGISRYITRSTSFSGDDDWVDHTRRAFDLRSVQDPNTFNIDVDDPNNPGTDVEVYLEALKPLYGPARALVGHQRFPVGAKRDACSLVVACSSVNGTARHRSCYLRLVVDAHDKAQRPRQTLLVTDAVDIGEPNVEILDQDIHVRYEYAGCPLPAGMRCLLAEHTIPLRRGRSVQVRPRILRAARTGVVGTMANGQGDDGVIPRQTALDRFHTHVRRIWAQEEIAFVLDPIETVDPPSDMLAFADPTGAASSGQNGGGLAGQLGFTIDLHTHGAGTVSHVLGPVVIAANQTPLQTATQIQGAVAALGIPGLVCPPPWENPAIDGHAGRSADLRFTYGPGFVELRNLTNALTQDSAQPVEIVAVDVNALELRALANNAYAGSSMQRALYTGFITNPRGINVFVVQSMAGSMPPLAHALNSQRYLPARYRPRSEMENCILISYEAMDPDLTVKPATLAHEIGHVLIDNAGHSIDDAAEGSLMNMATSQSFGTAFGGVYDTKRIIAWPVRWEVIAQTANPAGSISQAANGALCVAEQRHSMHSLIVVNNRILFVAR